MFRLCCRKRDGWFGKATSERGGGFGTGRLLLAGLILGTHCEFVSQQRLADSSKQPREAGPGQFQNSAQSILTSTAVRGYRLPIGPQGAGQQQTQGGTNGHRSSGSNCTRHSWSRCVHRTMKRSPGWSLPATVTRLTTREDSAAALPVGPQIPDPEATRQSLGKFA